MYRLTYTPDADADLVRLDKLVVQRVLKKLRWLAENFDMLTPEALTGELQGVFKLVIGDYRALYTFDKQERKIIVHAVKHRREVYKKR